MLYTVHSKMCSAVCTVRYVVCYVLDASAVELACTMTNVETHVTMTCADAHVLPVCKQPHAIADNAADLQPETS